MAKSFDGHPAPNPNRRVSKKSRRCSAFLQTSSASVVPVHGLTPIRVIETLTELLW
jgi:hypothetical protein